jgi:hypothetical protein
MTGIGFIVLGLIHNDIKLKSRGTFSIREISWNTILKNVISLRAKLTKIIAIIRNFHIVRHDERRWPI